MSTNEIAALVKDATGGDVSYTTIWKLPNGQAQNPQKRLTEALAQTFGVPPAFFFDDYDEQVEFLAVAPRRPDQQRPSPRHPRAQPPSPPGHRSRARADPRRVRLS
jgi:transcriptional regulator with XRE-family HTH domain